MSNQPKKGTNQVMASVLLKKAISSFEDTVFNCKYIIKDVIHLPHSSSTTKQLLCVANQVNHIETITKTIDIEISPYINIVCNTGYLQKRLKTLHSSSKSHHIPSTVSANLLPLPPSLSSPTKISSLSSSKSNATTTSTKKCHVLQSISTDTINSKSKRIRSKPLRTRNQLITNARPIPPTGHISFSGHNAMEVHKKYTGKGKMKLIKYWIDNNYITCRKMQFFKLYNLYKYECLPDDVQWMDGSGQNSLILLQEVEQLVTDTQNTSCSNEELC
jgi:hypothetical protein